MLPLKRRLVALFALLAIADATPRAAAQSSGQTSPAQTYPAQTVKLVVGFPPGGPTDIVARLMAQWLQERLRQAVVVENRPGAGSNIATQVAIASPPDGHTLILLSHANAINHTLYEKIAFDIAADVAPVAGLIQVPNVVLMHPSLPVRSIADLIAYAKAHPGVLNYASSGNGTSAHLAPELFKAATGTSIVHVPYRGSAAALTDMISGQMKLMFDSLPSSLEHVRAGTLTAIAVTSAGRLDVLPGIPAVAETLPGFEVVGWFGLGAPKATPKPIVERLNREVNAGLRDATLARRIFDLEATPHIVEPAAYAAFMARAIERWASAVKSSGAKVQ